MAAVRHAVDCKCQDAPLGVSDISLAGKYAEGLLQSVQERRMISMRFAMLDDG
ncbi:hypothetical protein [Rhizobium leguminosarum]|uniref:hypothetical protein n=1 Tax=Rhizobium leguminosarum TaxID=384 RepID=UPI0013EF1F32|nr:hypothetical protein [Rhizobium leguminosarum]